MKMHTKRGSALLVALMLMVALASVATVVLHKLTTEMTYVSTERKGTLAYHVTESGVFATLALADSLGAPGFLSTLDATSLDVQPGQSPGFNPQDLTVGGAPYFDLSQAGSFGYEGFVQSTSPDEDFGGKAPFDFRVSVTASGMVQPLVGYSLNGEGSRCRFKYRFDSDGTIGSQNQGKDSSTSFGAWKRIRALMYIGPLPCQKTSGSAGSS
jgi:hypothetical protein